MTANLPKYLVRMVRRSPPVPEVVRDSTPVVSFGDARKATVVTLGINQASESSSRTGVLLDGPSRRLATLKSLKAKSSSTLSAAQVRQVIADCDKYFHRDRNPYRRWFDPLDKLLRDSVGASYYDGTAAHLDLVQWATDPTWGKLRAGAKKTLSSPTDFRTYRTSFDLDTWAWCCSTVGK